MNDLSLSVASLNLQVLVHGHIFSGVIMFFDIALYHFVQDVMSTAGFYFTVHSV